MRGLREESQSLKPSPIRSSSLVIVCTKLFPPRLEPTHSTSSQNPLQLLPLFAFVQGKNLRSTILSANPRITACCLLSKRPTPRLPLHFQMLRFLSWTQVLFFSISSWDVLFRNYNDFLADVAFVFVAFSVLRWFFLDLRVLLDLNFWYRRSSLSSRWSYRAFLSN